MKIRGIVDLLGEELLGFTKEDVGLHSIKSGGAMAMFLSGVSEIIIQRIGRWESDAFLEYIREQVENFTWGVSAKMLMYESFHHLNEKDYEKVEMKPEELNPTCKGDGEPLLIPYSAHSSNQALHFTKF